MVLSEKVALFCCFPSRFSTFFNYRKRRCLNSACLAVLRQRLSVLQRFFVPRRSHACGGAVRLTFRLELRVVVLIAGAGLRIIDKIVEPVLEVTEGAARVLGMRARLGKAGRVLPVLLYRLRNITLHYLQP